MNDDFISVAFFTTLLVLAVIGAVFLCMDFRHFKEIVAQCEKQGYIQNETVRLTCAKESKHENQNL